MRGNFRSLLGEVWVPGQDSNTTYTGDPNYTAPAYSPIALQPVVMNRDWFVTHVMPAVVAGVVLALLFGREGR